MPFTFLRDIEDWCQEQMDLGYTKVLTDHIPDMVKKYLEDSKAKQEQFLMKEEARFIKISITEQTERLKYLESQIKK